MHAKNGYKSFKLVCIKKVHKINIVKCYQPTKREENRCHMPVLVKAFPEEV